MGKISFMGLEFIYFLPNEHFVLFLTQHKKWNLKIFSIFWTNSFLSKKKRNLKNCELVNKSNFHFVCLFYFLHSRYLTQKQSKKTNSLKKLLMIKFTLKLSHIVYFMTAAFNLDSLKIFQRFFNKKNRYLQLWHKKTELFKRFYHLTKSSKSFNE